MDQYKQILDDLRGVYEDLLNLASVTNSKDLLNALEPLANAYKQISEASKKVQEAQDTSK